MIKLKEYKKTLIEKSFKNQPSTAINLENKDNLVGFFTLLVRVDKRINPYLYKPVLK